MKPTYRKIDVNAQVINQLDEELNSCFVAIGSSLRTMQQLNAKSRLGGAVHGANRHSQIYRFENGDYSFDCWQDGVNIVKASTSSTLDLAHALHQLLELNQNPFEVQERLAFVTPAEGAKAYFTSAWNYTQFQWDKVASHLQSENEELHRALIAARKHPCIGKLFPFVSMGRLFFSRCTGYPFDLACSGIRPTNQSSYYNAQKRSDNEVEFMGKLNDCIDFIAAQLPTDCEPAHHGTAEDEYSSC